MCGGGCGNRLIRKNRSEWCWDSGLHIPNKPLRLVVIFLSYLFSPEELRIQVIVITEEFLVGYRILPTILLLVYFNCNRVDDGTRTSTRRVSHTDCSKLLILFNNRKSSNLT